MVINKTPQRQNNSIDVWGNFLVTIKLAHQRDRREEQLKMFLPQIYKEKNK
jgi:hypothetical protein